MEDQEVLRMRSKKFNAHPIENNKEKKGVKHLHLFQVLDDAHAKHPFVSPNFVAKGHCLWTKMKRNVQHKNQI